MMYFYYYYCYRYASNLLNPYYYQNRGQIPYKSRAAILKPQYRQLNRIFPIEYITNWFSNTYDKYKEFLFRCFYKQPYEFEKMKKCLQEEYNVPGHIAQNITDIAKYGYESSGWVDKRLFLNKLSGEWKTKRGLLKLYVSEELVPTDDVIFPYANKVRGSYNLNSGGKIEGFVNWGGVLSGSYVEPNKRGQFKIIFQEKDDKSIFKGTYTENGEEFEWEGEQIKEY